MKARKAGASIFALVLVSVVFFSLRVLLFQAQYSTG